MNKLITPQDTFFIAGARGMAGSAITRALIKRGYGSKEFNGKILSPNRQELDYLDKNSVDRWLNLNKPDVMVIAAAKVGGIIANSTFPADFILENIKIQTNLIESAWKNGVRRLLFLGSSCIYPKFSSQPIVEEELLGGALEPTNESYAIAKISGIKLCEALRIQHNFDAISLMPTNLYGTGDNYHPTNSHVLPALIRKFVEAKNNSNEEVVCWGSGKPMREFLHADDLGDACVYALENWSALSENSPKNKQTGYPLSHLNVGTGLDISIKDLAEMIANIVDYQGKIIWDISKPDGTPKKLLDVSRLKQIGWKNSINLEAGLIRTIEEFEDTSIDKRL